MYPEKMQQRQRRRGRSENRLWRVQLKSLRINLLLLGTDIQQASARFNDRAPSVPGVDTGQGRRLLGGLLRLGRQCLLEPVVDEAGRPLGAISLGAIIASMVTPTSHETKAA